MAVTRGSTEKAMAPHSSTLAWKIPRTEEPGRLQSMGSLRVGHDWSNLAAAEAAAEDQNQHVTNETVLRCGTKNWLNLTSTYKKNNALQWGRVFSKLESTPCFTIGFKHLAGLGVAELPWEPGAVLALWMSGTGIEGQCTSSSSVAGNQDSCIRHYWEQPMQKIRKQMTQHIKAQRTWTRVCRSHTSSGSEWVRSTEILITLKITQRYYFQEIIWKRNYGYCVPMHLAFLLSWPNVFPLFPPLAHNHVWLFETL